MTQLLAINSSASRSGSVSCKVVTSVVADDDVMFAQAKTEIATTAQAASGQKLAD